jgi:hypothetical protein
VDFIVYDENHNPIDKIERILKVEKPADPACTITVPPSMDTTWHWLWWSTYVVNPNNEITFANFAGKPYITETNYQGCCDPSQPDGRCNPLSTTLNATVNFKNYYSIEEEEFSFYSDGTYWRRTHERKRNFDPSTTQWCTGWPGFTDEHSIVYYNGTHDFSPGATRLNFGAGFQSCDICGYGSPGGDLYYSCNLIIITRTTPEGSKTQRMYHRSDEEISWLY